MTVDGDIEQLLERFERLEDNAEADDRLSEYDEDTLEAIEEGYREANRLLEEYRDRATGTGDFGGYLEFRQRFTVLVDALAEDLPYRDAFEDALEHIDRRRLSERDFDRARSALEPVVAVVEAISDRRDRREERDDVRHELRRHRSRLAEKRDELERLAKINPEAVDLPVEELKGPIGRYNEAVTSAHRRYLHERSIRDVLATYERMSNFALLDIDDPPEPLVTFFEAHPVGEEPVPTVCEYLDFSRSKLEHYVDDPGTFHGEVKPHRPYLDDLGPSPFTIDWPPPQRDRFTWELRELHQAIDRFADEETVSLLRQVQAFVRRGDRYDDLRSSAVLRQDLDETDRDLVLSGRVHDQLTAVEEQLGSIDEAIGH